MNCSLAKLTKEELENCVLPFIPKNLSSIINTKLTDCYLVFQTL
jgi:hypothetical protein